jgi:hypothetical protein
LPTNVPWGEHIGMERTHVSIRALVDRVDHGEIKLPEIQRAYVWKPHQVAHLFDSLYRRYPSGAMLLWRPADAVKQRTLQTGPPAYAPVSLPLYLLDGQQRLTSLHRVYSGHPDANVVFHVGEQRFQIQSAATAKNPRWVRVAEVLTAEKLSPVRRRVSEAAPDLDEDEVDTRLGALRRIGDYEYYLEILSGLAYEEVAQIFVRVNSGGRALKTVDLALATLSAEWPGVVAKIDGEIDRWKQYWPKIDAAFLVRALAAIATDNATLSQLRGLDAQVLDDAWERVRFGVQHLLQLLRENAAIGSSALIPAMRALIPLVVLLGVRKGEKLDDPKSLIYWLLGVFITGRYSSAADTKIAQDSLSARSDDPIRGLYRNAGLLGARLAVSEEQLIGKGAGSPFFLLSYLTAKSRGARDWWHGVEISETSVGSSFAIEYHHIHPRKTLSATYSKGEINDLANLAFISATANKKISDRSPAVYFKELEQPDELRPHLVPSEETMRVAENYREFLANRRRLLATAMTELLDRYRPAWVEEVAAAALKARERAVSLTLYDGANPRLLFEADRDGERFVVDAAFADLERFLSDARSQLASSFAIGSETASTEPEDEELRVPVGPFELTGSIEDWESVLERERVDSRPASEAPGAHNSPAFEGEREVFAVIDTD